MTFDPKIVEAKLALGMIGTTDLPRVAWDALEAGFDGPGIRRLAALNSPTYFELREVLPRVMREMGIVELPSGEAALRLGGVRAKQILDGKDDPLRHTADFFRMWMEADYCRELKDVGLLADEVHVAHEYGQSETEIRAWVLERIRALAES